MAMRKDNENEDKKKGEDNTLLTLCFVCCCILIILILLAIAAYFGGFVLGATDQNAPITANVTLSPSGNGADPLEKISGIANHTMNRSSLSEGGEADSDDRADNDGGKKKKRDKSSKKGS